MKSAYELALERLEQQGIEKPREEGLPEELRQRLAEIRSKADARLAELEILHKKTVQDRPEEAAELEADYRAERERIERNRDLDLERLRSSEL